MNPFIESTVARPLPKNHHDHRWQETPAETEPHPSTQTTAAGPSFPPGTRNEVVENKGASSQSGSAKRRGVPLRSALATIGLCFTLMMSGFAGAGASPAYIVGIAAAAGTLLPRSAQAVDLNRATAQELQTIRGIGPKTARTIIDERTRGGDYESLTDLSDRVKGIGPKKAAALQAAGLTLASGSASATSRAVDAATAQPVSTGRSKKR